MDIINIHRFICFDKPSSILVVCSFPSIESDMTSDSMAVCDALRRLPKDEYKIVFPLNATCIDTTIRPLVLDDDLKKWNQSYGRECIRVDRGNIIKGEFPDDIPLNTTYDIVWFAGCNVPGSIFKTLENVYKFKNMLHSKSLVCITEKEGYHTNSKSKLPVPFLTYRDYIHQTPKIQEFFNTLDDILVQCPYSPFFKLRA